MKDVTPKILKTTSCAHRLVSVQGRFYRAVPSDPTIDPLRGSRKAGRYSRAGQSNLYLSASEAGVFAAMQAHPNTSSDERITISLDVVAEAIFDLRDMDACRAAGIDRNDAFAPWQEIAESGGTPASWRVRDQLVALGARGLIDPSRQSPGLWHLCLFDWNTADAATVNVVHQLPHNAA